MFGLFKKKESVKEYKFLTKDDANKISQDFISSGKYDEGTLRLIKCIEGEISYNASKGFGDLYYQDFHVGFSFNKRLLLNHFENNGYKISDVYFSTPNGQGEVYIHMEISWK